MKIHIDLSLFYDSTGSFGRVHGYLEIPYIPSIGSQISFLFPINEKIMPCIVKEFPGIMKVTEVIYTPSREGGSTSIHLDDVVLHSKDAAKTVMRYLEEGFGLYGDEYDG
jgi:hypothetical protein